MAMYLIGDVQGCDAPLAQLLDKIAFSPSRDTVFILGDLVNRGPESAAVLRRLMAYGQSARCLLGNHDLNLLAVAHGIRKPHRKDTLDSVLLAPDRDRLLDWLAHQRLAMLTRRGDRQLLMVHAGVLPTWTVEKTLELAGEVEKALQSPQLPDFLHTMYGNQPDTWDDALVGADRLRVTVNALTRLRFCTAQGQMEFSTTGSPDHAPAGYWPWFEVPGRKTADIQVAFGHWSTLGWLNRPDVLSMDTGCLWGGCLSALRLTDSSSGQGWDQELIQVQCAQTQRPGDL